MDRIDYIYPTALEQIKATITGGTVPTNDGNRDGGVQDVRYFSSAALDQIKSVTHNPNAIGIDGTDRYRLLIGLLSVDLATQAPQIVIANNAPIVKGANGKYQFTLDSTVWTQWLTTYNAIKQANPDSAREMCHVMSMIVKDCPSDILPQKGDTITEQIGALVPYVVNLNEDGRKLTSMDIRVTYNNAGTLEYPPIFYNNAESLEEMTDVDVMVYNNFFGYFMDFVLANNTSITSWYIDLFIPLTTEENGVAPVQIIMPNPYSV